MRSNCWEWYTSVVRTRMHNTSRELIVFTRWHEEDLIGEILKREPAETLRTWSQLDTTPPDHWLHLNFEALSLPPTEIDPWPRARPFGKRSTAPRCWPPSDGSIPLQFEAMYQGHPSSRERAPLRAQLPEYDTLPHEIVRRANYTDTADTGDDYLCSISYVVDADGVIYLTDAVYSREPMELTEPMVADLLLRSDTRQAAIESNNGGRGFARAVQARTPGVRIEWFHQSGNKEARILSNSATVLHLLRFPRGWSQLWPEMYAHLTTYRRQFRTNRWHDAADVLTGIVERETAAAAGGCARCVFCDPHFGRISEVLFCVVPHRMCILFRMRNPNKMRIFARHGPPRIGRPSVRTPDGGAAPGRRFKTNDESMKAAIIGYGKMGREIERILRERATRSR